MCQKAIKQLFVMAQKTTTLMIALIVLSVSLLVVAVFNMTIQIYDIFGTQLCASQSMESITTSTSFISQLANSVDAITQQQKVLASQIQNTSEFMNGLQEKLQQCSLCPLPTSCQEIKNKQPNSVSGVYLLATPSGDTNYVYCHMGELCGTEGGWARLACLNMSDSTQNCPTGFRLYESNEVRACGRATSSVGSCQSVQFPSNNISYFQVCGRVVGYQYGSTDADYPGGDHGSAYGSVITPQHNDINSYYVDGVSITHGSPRQHIWTLMAGNSNSFLYNKINCPCSQGSLQNSTLQSFIGEDYFCESGNPNFSTQAILYTQDPLWDGKGCGSLEGNCCSVPGLPWFNNILNSTTNDYIELRVCADQGTNDEDVPVSFYELYIK